MRFRICTMAGLLGLASVSILSAAAPNLPKADLSGSLHDFGGVGCKGCHAPHNGAASGGGTGNQNTGLIMLWAKSFPSGQTYGTYQSPTMTTTPAELGSVNMQATTTPPVQMYSLLCLSCHDGVTSTYTVAAATTTYPPPTAATGSMYQADMVGAPTGSANSSMGLTNDHPINMNYPASTTAGFVAVGTVSAAIPLFGTGNSIQCATCHDPHSNKNTMFLRQANNSAGCTTCHS